MRETDYTVEKPLPKWRILLGLVLYIPVLMLVSYPFELLSSTLLRNTFINNNAAAGKLLSLAPVLLGTYLMVVFWDRRTLSSLGLTLTRQTTKLVGQGLLIGGLLISLALGVELAGGWAAVRHIGPVKAGSGIVVEKQLSSDQIHKLSPEEKKAYYTMMEQKGWPDEPAGTWPQLLWGMLSSLVMFFLGAINEEVIFRGYFLQGLRRGWGVPGVLISSLLFIVFHIHGGWNGGTQLLAQDIPFYCNIFLAGLLFSYAYLITGSLWFPVAMHCAWNYLQGPVYGFAVSGVHHGPEAFLLAIQGPAIFTGGNWGLEGSLAASAALMAGLAGLYLWRRCQTRTSEEMGPASS